MAGVKGQRSGGQNAKTVAEHKLEGTYERHRHEGIRNPEPPSGDPIPPKPISGEVAEQWVLMIDWLKQCKTLSTVDGAVLYQYCNLFVETEQLMVDKEETDASIDRLEENLSGLEGKDLVACFQEISKLRQLHARYGSQIRQGRMSLKSYLVEFGLTPASRGRVKLPEAPPKNEWDDFDGADVQ